MDVPVDVTHITLTTDRLLLRAPKSTDLYDLFSYASVPGVGESAGWKHHESIRESQAILQMLMDQRDVLAVIHKADRKMIGTVGLHRSWANGEEAYRRYKVREIGYVLSMAYWGQGLMPEAVNAVIRYAFDTLGLEALTCCHFMENNRSRRVIEKCGFQFIKTGTYKAEQLQKTFADMQYILMAKGAEGKGEADGADQTQSPANTEHA